MKLRVLHVIPSLEKEFGGPAFALLEMVREQRAQGVTVSILTTNSQRQIPNVVLKSFRACPNSYRFSLPLYLWLEKNIEKYDVVHIHSIFNFPTLAASRLAQKYKVPYIIRTCGQLYQNCLYQKKMKKMAYIKLFEANNLKKAGFIHYTTLDEKESAGIVTSHHSYVLGLGVSECPKISRGKFSALFPGLSDKKIILFMGRIHPHKGINLLLSSLPKAFFDSLDWVLVLAGSGDRKYFESLQEFVAKNNLGQKVKFIGPVIGERKHAILQYAKIFILPSQSENFGIVVAETLVCGRPVAISDKVALSKSVKENKSGYIFPLTSQSIGKTITVIIRNESMLEKMAINAKRQGRTQFNWSEITREQISYYQKAIKNNR